MVRVEEPGGEFRLGETVSFEEPEPATELGLKDELVRTGNPLILKFTVPANGPDGEIVTL